MRKAESCEQIASDEEDNNRHNDKILFNQKNFLGDMMANQNKKSPGKQRHLTFGKDDDNSNSIYPPSAGKKGSKSLYMKKGQNVNKDEEDPEVNKNRSKSFSKRKADNRISADTVDQDEYNNFFAKTKKDDGNDNK